MTSVSCNLIDLGCIVLLMVLWVCEYDSEKKTEVYQGKDGVVILCVQGLVNNMFLPISAL